jgi:hypothetical protein
LHCQHIKPENIDVYQDTRWGESYGKMYYERLEEYNNNGWELIVPSCDVKIKDGLATLEDVLLN